MRLNLRVTYNDGSAVDVTASAADFVAFEMKWDKSVVKIGEDVRMTDLCWMSWHSLHRQKQTPLDFDAWLETVDSVKAGGSAEITPLETNQPIG